MLASIVVRWGVARLKFQILTRIDGCQALWEDQKQTFKGSRGKGSENDGTLQHIRDMSLSQFIGAPISSQIRADLHKWFARRRQKISKKNVGLLWEVVTEDGRPDTGTEVRNMKLVEAVHKKLRASEPLEFTKEELEELDERRTDVKDNKLRKDR